jgi:hypothetical protein
MPCPLYVYENLFRKSTANTSQPFTDADVQSLVSNFLSKNEPDTEQLITHILKELKPKTVDYKLLVTVSVISGETETNNKHSVGFLWDDENDGNYIIKEDIEDGTIVVSVTYFKL